MKFAEQTSVSVEKSRAELEQILRRYGASKFGYLCDDHQAAIQFMAGDKTVRFILPLPDQKERRFTHSRHTWPKLLPPHKALENWEQGCRTAWRALVLCVKAKLEAVASKITTFEQEFLAHLVLPNGRTVTEQLMPEINSAISLGEMPSFTLALPAKRED